MKIAVILKFSLLTLLHFHMVTKTNDYILCLTKTVHQDTVKFF